MPPESAALVGDDWREVLGISTSWNGRPPGDLKVMLDQIEALGFRRVELYAAFTRAQLNEVSRLIQERGLAVTSLHSPCPIPEQRINDWLASPNPAERAAAVDAGKRTLDAAAELGARGIVVHLGHVSVSGQQQKIFSLIRERGTDDPAVRELVREAWQAREAAKAPHLAAAIESARELGEHARGSAVGVGLECRDGYHEIPSLDEIEQALEACAGLPVYYWHDAGHGQKLQNAGFVRHEDYLRRYHERMLGIHLHDTRLDRDHQAPGLADTDFTMLARYIDCPIRTLELSSRERAEDILRGVELLCSVGIG